MAEWHNRALELTAQNLSKKEVTERIEEEFGLTDMYNTVRCFLYKREKSVRGKKGYNFPLCNCCCCKNS